MEPGAQTDPYAGIGTPVGPPPPSGGTDPYAGIGTPVGPPPPSGGTDPYAGIGTPAAATPAPAAAAPAGPEDLTHDPTNSEGVYKLGKWKGGYLKGGVQDVVGIPYSNVEKALAQGYEFADPKESDKYNADHTADPKRPREGMENFARRFFSTAKEHAAGVQELFRKMGQGPQPIDYIEYQEKHPEATTDQVAAAVEGRDLNSQMTGPYRAGKHEADLQHLKESAEFLKQSAKDEAQGTEGFGGWSGEMTENMTEFLGLEGLSKLAILPKVAEGVEGLSQAEKLAAAAKAAKVLKDNPKIAQLTAVGLRTLYSAGKAGVKTGAMSGAQTYVDTGGDTGAATSSALYGGATGAALTGVIGGVGEARAAYAAKAGEATRNLEEYQKAMNDYRQLVHERLTNNDARTADWQKAKETQTADHAKAVAEHKTVLQQRAAEIEKARAAHKAALDQQAQAHNAAMDAYNEQLGKTTEANQKAMDDWKAQLDAQKVQHAADLEDFKKQNADHAQTVNSLKNEAATALQTQRQLEAQQGIRNIAKDATEDGLARFNEALGGASEHVSDAAAGAEDVSSFGDTVSKWQEAAKPVYGKIDEATGGEFNKLQAARARAVRAHDFTESTKLEGQIDSVLEKQPEGVTPQEWRAAKGLWRDSKDMERIHAAVEGAFNGISEDMSTEPGTSPRIVRGEALQRRLGMLLRGKQAMSEARIKELIGPDGLAGLYRVSHMSSTPELKAATQELVDAIVKELPPPAKPIAPEPIARPDAIPAPEKPEAPAKLPKPAIPPRPNGPVKPLVPEKPEPVPRPTPPTKPSNLPKKPLAYGEIGKNTITGAAGALLGPHVGLSATQGAEAALLARYVMRQIVTNPAIGKMAEYAVDYGATPQNAAKLIAAMIAKNETDASNQGQQ